MDSLRMIARDSRLNDNSAAAGRSNQEKNHQAYYAFSGHIITLWFGLVL